MATNKSLSSQDVNAEWITQSFGQEWLFWEESIAKWLKKQTKSLSPRLTAIRLFVTDFLVKHDLPRDAGFFLVSQDKMPDLYTAIKAELTNDTVATMRYNFIRDLCDSIILEHFSEPDDFGKPLPQISNPFPEKTTKSNPLRYDTPYSSLPYKYIKELRNILCPVTRGNFSDWKWASQSASSADWFIVSRNDVDLTDPDCVWRECNGKDKSEVEIWCPVKAMVIYLKLLLPLRTYQVRMLDSGESDYYRYINGQWTENNVHPFAATDIHSSGNKGVFRKTIDRATGVHMTGLFISTNKTADLNKDEVDKGYCIPWQHEDVLYWCEKLRNWQEKYNPISKMTAFIELEPKHLGLTKSVKALKEMGSQCFLMRNAAASSSGDKSKPIPPKNISIYWHTVLCELESRVESRCHFTGEPLIKLVKSRNLEKGEKKQTETYYPLHSLRVALLTCLALDGGVPTPVLSKLIAGHSRLLMTYHYMDITPNVMTQKMSEAELKIEANSENNFRNFLANTDIDTVLKSLAYIDEESTYSALMQKMSVGWEPKSIGFCLATSNSSEMQQSESVRGCWNGYKSISGTKISYLPVPNGPENCVRCRWFVTEARYLNDLRAHFNLISYKASESANLAMNLEQQLQELEDEMIVCLNNKTVFTKASQIELLEGRVNKQLAIANEYASDLNACFILISKLITIESNRTVTDDKTKLIAVGSYADVQSPIALIETDSKLWQLSEICEDAELYPDIADEVLTSSIVHQRTEQLNLALMKDGYQPVFMALDDKMKLIAGNAMMRAMAKEIDNKNWRGDGLKRVANLMEAGQFLSQNGLLKSGIESMQGTLTFHNISCALQPSSKLTSGV